MLVLLLVMISGVAAYDNGVALRPALGWNTWCTLSDCHNGDNQFFDRCNEWEIKSMAQAMIDIGLKDVGFEYINLDDCWGNTQRDANDNIQPDPDRFPSGMKATADWLHSVGLKFGLYTSMGDTTCNPGGRPANIPGSFGHYEADAKTFASWGMDYVKVDWCGGHLTNPQQQHTEFSNALNATGRPIWLELCRGYSYTPIPSYVAEVAQSWRLTGDHQDEWSNTVEVIRAFFQPSNPGVPHAWNYGDFLMTGGPGCNVNETLHCPRSADDEYRTEFAAWAISASSLIVSTDIRNMTAVMKQCLLNKQAIAINQDYMAPAGKLVGRWTCEGGADCPVLGRSLSDGSYAAVLMNLDDFRAHNVTMPFSWLGLKPNTTAQVVDVLNSKPLGSFTDSFSSGLLTPHQSVFVHLTVQARL